MSKKRILYIMHIPWGWIKQRPHFLAEYLANDFDVDVKHRLSNRLNQSHLINKIPDQSQYLKVKGYRLISFEKIPFIKRFNLNWINRILFYISINRLERYDYIWITSPLIYQYIQTKHTKNKLIYDCMDDFLEFPDVKNNPIILKKFFNLEKQLLSNADIVFCSSSHLTTVLQKRYNTQRGIHIVNNAITIYEDNNKFEFPKLTQTVIETIKSFQNPFIYIGTISSWFDFDSVLALLKANESINILLYGPVGCPVIPAHKRLHMMGTLEHKSIYEVMKYAKALIMPFKINDLILSVNPVKLYEYIYSGKPIIASRYGETEKLNDYIFLYKNSNEFVQLANNIVDEKPRKMEEMEMKKYALQNTWESRYNHIKQYL